MNEKDRIDQRCQPCESVTDRLLMVYILNNNVPKIAGAQKVHHVVHIKSKSRVQN